MSQVFLKKFSEIDVQSSEMHNGFISEPHKTGSRPDPAKRHNRHPLDNSTVFCLRRGSADVPFPAADFQ